MLDEGGSSGLIKVGGCRGLIKGAVLGDQAKGAVVVLQGLIKKAVLVLRGLQGGCPGFTVLQGGGEASPSEVIVLYSKSVLE